MTRCLKGEPPGSPFHQREGNMKQERTGSRGQGILELALMLPVVLLLIAGMLDVARAVQSYVVVHHAAREAARYGMNSSYDWSGMISVAEDELDRGGLDSDNAIIVANAAAEGLPLQVTVTYSFTLITTVWSSSPIQLSSTAEMVAL